MGLNIEYLRENIMSFNYGPGNTNCNNNSTECIEICTRICLNKQEKYLCFDSCTKERCINGLHALAGTGSSSDYTLIFVLLLIVLIFCICALSFRKSSKYKYSYWKIV